MRSPRGLVFARIIYPFCSDGSSDGVHYCAPPCVCVYFGVGEDSPGGGVLEGGEETAGEDYLISFSLFFMSAARPVGRTAASARGKGEGPKGHCSSNLYESPARTHARTRVYANVTRSSLFSWVDAITGREIRRQRKGSLATGRNGSGPSGGSPVLDDGAGATRLRTCAPPFPPVNGVYARRAGGSFFGPEARGGIVRKTPRAGRYRWHPDGSGSTSCNIIYSLRCFPSVYQ